MTQLDSTQFNSTQRASNCIRRFVLVLYNIRNPQTRQRTGSVGLIRLISLQSPHRYSTPTFVVPSCWMLLLIPPWDSISIFVMCCRSCCCCTVVGYTHAGIKIHDVNDSGRTGIPRVAMDVIYLRITTSLLYIQSITVAITTIPFFPLPLATLTSTGMLIN